MPIEILEDRIAPASILVTSLADSGPSTLRTAIIATNSSTATTLSNGSPANTIEFANGLHGTIHLKSALPVITNDVAIAVPGDEKVTINGQNKFQIFNIESPSGTINVDITNLTLTHGMLQAVTGTQPRGGGAIYINDYYGIIKMSQCVITKNEAIGAIGAKDSAGIGGGIDVIAGTLDLSNSKMTGNVAKGGHSTTAGAAGGIGMGGALYVGESGTLVVTTSIISGNVARGGNGETGAAAVAATGTNAGNRGGNGGVGGSGEGGGIWTYGNVKINKSTISGNVAVGGHGGKGGSGSAGGVGANGGSGGFGGSGGRSFGGGVYTEGNFLLYASTVSGNTANSTFGTSGGAGGKAGPGGKGGGSNGATPGKSLGYGGGIDTRYGEMETLDATIANNGADEGGGIFDYASKTTLYSSTIAFNHARKTGYGGGLAAYLEQSEPTVIVSTVIGQNTTGGKSSSQDVDVVNSAYIPTSLTIAADNSLIQSVISTNITPISGTGEIIEGVSAMLKHLHNNGGPTLTCLPAAVKSPLLGEGTIPLILPTGYDLLHDQRGYPRAVAGTVDIGAVEIA